MARMRSAAASRKEHVSAGSAETGDGRVDVGHESDGSRILPRAGSALQHGDAPRSRLAKQVGCNINGDSLLRESLRVAAFVMRQGHTACSVHPFLLDLFSHWRRSH